MILSPQEQIRDYTEKGWWGTETLADLFLKNASSTPGRVALVDPPNRAEFTNGQPRRLTYADLFTALEEASAALGRKVAPTIYSSKELAKRVKQDNAFVTRVLAQPKLWLIGGESDLAA